MLNKQVVESTERARSTIAVFNYTAEVAAKIITRVESDLREAGLKDNLFFHDIGLGWQHLEGVWVIAYYNKSTLSALRNAERIHMVIAARDIHKFVDLISEVLEKQLPPVPTSQTTTTTSGGNHD